MKKSFLGALSLISFALLGGCGSSDDSSSGNDFCAKSASVTSDLKCSAPKNSCSDELSQASATAKSTNCESQFDAINACAVNQPSSSFECDTEDGGVSLKDGFCSDEQSAFSTCFAGHK